MTTIRIQDLERDPEAALARIEAGETLRIVRGEREVAELRPIPVPTVGLRPVGLCEGLFTVPNDFDSPLPESVLREFDGS